MRTGRDRPHSVVLMGLIGTMVLIWGVNFIIGKVALRHLDALTLASFRVVLSALLILPVFFALPRRSSFSREDLGKFAQLGLLGVAINQVCFTVGLHYTTVSHSSLIIGMGPIYVLLLAWFQGLEQLTAKKLFGMALAFSGVAVLAGEEGFDLQSGSLVGDLITLAGSWAFALYAVLGKKVAAKYGTIEMNTFNYLAGAVLILPLAARQALELDWGAVGWEGWAGLLYMAAFASVAAYLIFYWALRYVAASRLSAFSYLLPVVATVLSILLLGEQVTKHLLVGGSMVLVGVYLTEIGLGREAEEAGAEEDVDPDVH